MSSKVPRRALLIVDVQNDFCPPNGALKVAKGDEVVATINSIRKKYKWDLVCLSQDWHPADHMSFAANNKGSSVFTEIDIGQGRKQMMWPVHCVQGSKGSEFRSDLIVDRKTDKIIRKGTHQHVDSYSAFFDNDKKTQTNLDKILKEAKIDHVFVTGLAFDYCVGFTALDAKSLGYSATVVVDASRCVAPESEAAMTKRLTDAGIDLVNFGRLVVDTQKKSS